MTPVWHGMVYETSRRDRNRRPNRDAPSEEWGEKILVEWQAERKKI